MQAYQIHRGGRAGPGNMGQVVADVNSADIEAALNYRGYRIASEGPKEHIPVTPSVPSLTKGQAINVAIDEALPRLGVPHTTIAHPYHAPTEGTLIPDNTWYALVDWCAPVANGYLTGRYALPAWAQSHLAAGILRKDATQTIRGLGNLRGLSGGFGEWLNTNPWFLKSVGDTITNYGEYLTAKNVEAAIKANTAQQLTKADMTALVAALQAGGYVPTGKTGTVAEGAMMAAQPSWMMPALIGGGIFLAVMVMKK